MALNLLKTRDIISKLIWLEQARFVLWTPVALGLGIAFYFLLGSEPPLWAGTAAFIAFLQVFWLSRNCSRTFIPMFCLCFTVVSLGFSTAQWRTILVSASVLPRAIGPTTVEGRIVDVEVRTKGSRVTLEKLRINGIGPESTPEKIRINLAGTQPAMIAGNWIRIRARLTPPPPPAAPGAYDFQRRFFFAGIGAVGFSYGRARITSSSENSNTTNPLSGTKEFWTRLRSQIGQRVRNAFSEPGELATGAVTRALMTGERGGIPEPVMDDFRDSGIAHLLAISGLHIGLVAGIVFVGLRGFLALSPTLALKYPIKKWAAVAAIFSALGYAMIAGATVPTMRAFLMIGVVLAAIVFERRGLSLRLIAFAAFVILLIKPESLLGASFQLSFAAVTALVAVYEGVSKKNWRLSTKGRGWGPRVLLYMGGVALTTLIAGAATAPYAAFHFNRFADYGLATNLLAVPLTALWIMPWAVAAFALMPLGLEALALAPMGAGVRFVIQIAHEVTSWPGAVTLLPAMETWAIAAITLGGLWLCLWQLGWRWFGLVGVAAGLTSMFWVQSPDILIDGKGKLLALRDDKGRMVVSSLKTAKFTRDIWLRRAAQDGSQTWMQTIADNSQSLACDSLGCIYHIKGRKVALIRDVGAIDEDCLSVDIVISSVPVRTNCRKPAIVIDRFDLWRKGTHALWFYETGRVRIETVNGIRGNRPWVLPATSRRALEEEPET